MAKKETAVLVGICLPEEDMTLVNEHLDELAMLAKTAGAKVLKRFTQHVRVPHRKYFVGPGKLNQIKEYVNEQEADIVIFDDELGPSQLKNLEQELKCKILDRSNLILDIFASRAQTAQAKTQVDLAQMEYLLPRLTRMWTHLSRQKGGIGMKGPGEKEIETDRRIVRNKIALLKEKLEKIEKQSATRRKSRTAKVTVALVGYTNAGKSTLMNMLSDAEILAEDKLFATLDTTVRKVVYEGVPFLLSDTVGFIRKLPHTLVESFKSTLDEVKEADILLHVVDISHPAFEHHMSVVKQTLKELNASDKPVLVVYNKIDAYSIKDEKGEEVTDFKEKLKILRESYLAEEADAVFVSAVQKVNIDELRRRIIEKVKEIYAERYPFVTYNDNFVEDNGEL